jgi:protoporphyrinogen oxidase
MLSENEVVMSYAGRYDVIVVGSGLSGLTAAVYAYAARGRGRVLVLERSSRLGGRAATTDRQGYRFNIGAHALYREGATAKMLSELAVPFTAAAPSLSGLFVYCDGHLHTFPSGGVSLLVSAMLDIRGKREWGNFFAALPHIEPASLDSTTVDDWLLHTVADAGARETIRALTRLHTFIAESA